VGQRKKFQLRFCVGDALATPACLPLFWTPRVLEIWTWDQSGILEKGQRSHDSEFGLMDTKDLLKASGWMRVRTHHTFIDANIPARELPCFLENIRALLLQYNIFVSFNAFCYRHYHTLYTILLSLFYYLYFVRLLPPGENPIAVRNNNNKITLIF
jgi:hypothetical protein